MYGTRGVRPGVSSEAWEEICGPLVRSVWGPSKVDLFPGRGVLAESLPGSRGHLTC